MHTSLTLFPDGDDRKNAILTLHTVEQDANSQLFYYSNLQLLRKVISHKGFFIFLLAIVVLTAYPKGANIIVRLFGMFSRLCVEFS